MNSLKLSNNYQGTDEFLELILKLFEAKQIPV